MSGKMSQSEFWDFMYGAVVAMLGVLWFVVTPAIVIQQIVTDNLFPSMALFWKALICFVSLLVMIFSPAIIKKIVDVVMES